MSPRSKLLDVRVPSRAEAVVLVVHGGGSRTDGAAVSPTQLSVVRMIPIARRVARVGRHRLAVFRLLNSTRGWNTRHTPVDDVSWALTRIADRLGAQTPVGLVGHSLGGRAALLSSAQPAVRSVVALAPWVHADDGAVDASGTRVLIVHGTADRIASPQRSAAAAAALRRTADSLVYVSVDGGKHAMLSQHRAFSGPAADFTAAALLDPAPDGTAARVAALVDGFTG